MPMKYKKDQKVLVDRKSRKVKTVKTFIANVPTDTLEEDLLKSNTPPKLRQKIRNELTRRAKMFEQRKNNS